MVSEVNFGRCLELGSSTTTTTRAKCRAHSKSSIVTTSTFFKLSSSIRRCEKSILSEHADHPSLALATPILIDRNFQPWKRDFKLSIGTRNKILFLDGSFPQPSPNDPLFSFWIWCNQMVMSWILHSVSPDIKSSIMYMDIASQMWTELNNRFNQGNGPRIFELNESIIFLNQGHLKDKCYFLQGFPPDYGNRKSNDQSASTSRKPTNQNNNHATSQASQVSSPCKEINPSQLTNDQCQQSISMLSQQLQLATSTSTEAVSATNFSGTSQTSKIGIAEKLGNLYYIKEEITPANSLHISCNVHHDNQWHNQQHGIDYFDTYAPVAKFNTLKLLLALAVIKNWHLHHMDINNAFLHGLEVDHSDKGISVSHEPFTLQLVQETGYLGAKLVSTPMEPNTRLSRDNGEPLPDSTIYRSLIRKLTYLTISKPDINFAVNKLSQYLQCP
uniref:Reverse transcriptase Ty1/copia-type domain-containing protein n=1 Tax=Cannabis sativa TaxID=3483 RepID=A0A803PSF8_CANSA